MTAAFVELSSAVTGFSTTDLEATGLVSTYLDVMTDEVSAPTVDDVLVAWERVVRSGEPVDEALRTTLFVDDRLGPIVRSLIKLWYLGQWEDPADPSHVRIISTASFREGLVWDAINAHPPGAKQQGFGTWSLPPNYLEVRAS